MDNISHSIMQAGKKSGLHRQFKQDYRSWNT